LPGVEIVGLHWAQNAWFENNSLSKRARQAWEVWQIRYW